ncbi:MAG: RNA polymerase sigma-70 factor [Rhodothermales bacterium]
MTPSAFQNFFREMYPQAVRFAQSRLGDRQQAEDIVQDVFVRMWENRRRIATDRSPKAYLFKLVANAIIDHYRHEKVKQRHAEHMLAGGPALTPAHDPTQEEDILRAIDDLPEKESTVFRLNRFAGMTYAETARYLGVSQKTVEKHMSRALARLGTSLRDFLVVLIALLTLAVAGAAHGQDRTAEFAASSVDIQLEGMSLRDALSAVAARTGAGLVFDDAMVESRMVGPHCSTCPLKELMRDVLAPHGLAFELMGGPVIVVVRGRGLQLTGRVVDAETGESLPLAQVWTGSTGGVADEDGWFSLTVPADGATHLTVSYMGYEHRMVRVEPGNLGTIALRPRTIVVGEVTVIAEPVIPVSGDGSGARLMRGGTMDRIPTIGGDDPLLAMQMLPGMDNTGERAGEMFIRGATPRTNLVTWDGIPVFSADHFFGMISTFSPQAVGEVKTYPRGVPAHLGGRAGTVVELASPSGLGHPQLLAHSSVLVSGASVRIPLGPRMGGWISARRSTPAIEQQTAYSSFFDKAIGEEFEANRPGFTFSDVSARLDVLAAARHHVSFSLHTSDDGLDRNTSDVFRQLELVNEQTEEEEEENENRGRGQGRGRGGDDDDDDDGEEDSDADDDEGDAEFVETVVTERERTNNDWSLTGAALNWTANWAAGAPMHVQVTRSRSRSSYAADLSELAADTLAFSAVEDRRHSIEQQAIRVRQELPSALGSTTVGAFFEGSRSRFAASTVFNTVNAFDSTSVRDMTLAGGHVAQEMRHGPVRLQAGIRLTRLSTNGAWYTAPRVAADVALTGRLSAQVFWGQYHQYMLRSLDSDILVERRDSWALVDAGQDPARSRQAGASLEMSGRAWSLSADVWRRTSLGVPVLPEATPRADVRPFNGDETHTLGMDVGGQVRISGVVALVSYTYTESEARSPAFPGLGWFRSLSERPHAVKGVVSAPVGPVTVGVSYSLASGRPVGVLLDPRRFVSADGSQLLGSAAASLDGEQLPPYRRLDVDVEWTGRIGGLNMAAAVSAVNVLDRQNVRYRRIVTEGTSVLLRDVTMLGFTPTASLRIGLNRP